MREAEEDQTAVCRRLRRLTEGAPDPAAVAGSDPVAVAVPDPAGGPWLDAVDGAVAAATGAAARHPQGAGGWPGAFDPGRRGVRALAVVAALVVLGAAALAWRARPRPEPVVAPVPAASAAVVASATAPAGIVVAVAGRVRRPGLVHLPAGARVADALAAAGGVLPGTDVAFLNLARQVADGELIVVGVTPPPGVAGGAPAPATGTGGKVHLNTATLVQLDTLPGVGPVLAQRILDYRERHGGFGSVGELRQVEGIGDARYEQLRELVAV